RDRSIARRGLNDAAAASRGRAPDGGTAVASVQVRRLPDRLAGLSGSPSAARSDERARGGRRSARGLESGSVGWTARVHEPAAAVRCVAPRRGRLGTGALNFCLALSKIPL